MDQEQIYEKFLGIKTDDEEIVPGLTKELEYSLYEASEYEGLIRVFDELTLSEDDCLVDFGCGMGRVLFYCNQRFRCRVTGIEYDQEIYDRLCDNAEYFLVRFRDQRRNIHLLHMKAQDYDIDKCDNVFYMFNPFGEETLRQVMDKITESVKKTPRDVKIILYYCTNSMLNVMRDYKLTLYKVIKLPSYRLDPYEKVYIYSI